MAKLTLVGSLFIFCMYRGTLTSESLYANAGHMYIGHLCFHVFSSPCKKRSSTSSGRHLYISLKRRTLCPDTTDVQFHRLPVLVKPRESISCRSGVPAQQPDVICITKVFETNAAARECDDVVRVGATSKHRT